MFDRINSVLSRLREGRVGFRMDEEMRGTHEFESGMGPEGVHPFSFRVSWGPSSLLAWLNPLGGAFLMHPVQGDLTAIGLCEKAPCEGTMELDYFGHRRIRYALTFRVKEVTYAYVGEKVNILPWNLATSHTTCFGTVKEVATGRLVSRSVVYFHLGDSARFLKSLRLA